MEPARTCQESLMSRCPFCEIVEGDDPLVREVARNDSVVVFFPTEPAVLGHCMVVPRRHVERFSDLAAEEVKEVMLAAQSMTRGVREAFEPEGINIIQSNGEAASQSVPHIHVHILPRWKGDVVGEIWPPESDYSDSEIDQSLVKLRAKTVLPSGQVSAEDKRQHLAFAQDVITRMAQSSSNAKSWLLPVATAAYGYAFTKDSIAVAVLGIIATLVFSLLDYGYLSNERKFRELYDRIAAGDPSIPPFSLRIETQKLSKKQKISATWSVIKTWTIWPFYGVLLVTGVAALILALLSSS